MQFDRLLAWLLRPLPTAVRLMMVKDLRLFRRDPLQWSQILIFAGFLVVYFFNIRRFTYESPSDYIGWVNMVSFLNLSVVGLLLSTFTTRFVFPMISLEGRRFWILGLRRGAAANDPLGQVPLRRRRDVAPLLGLVLLSDLMLNVSTLVM